MNSDDVYAALRKHYGQAAVLVAEVGDSVGHSCKRHVDAIAIGCWPSRGLYLHGIEIKVSRNDVRRELKNPAKADAIGRFCDRFFLAAPTGVVATEELPETWGLYEVDDDRVKVTKPAAQIAAVPVERTFLFSVARALVSQASPEAERSRIEAEAERRGFERGYAMNEKELALADERHQASQRELLQIKSALRGRDIWEISKAIEILDSLSGKFGSLNAVRVAADQVKRQADEIEGIVKRLLAKEEAAE